MPTQMTAQMAAYIANEATYMRRDNDPLIKAVGALLAIAAHALTNPPSAGFAFDYERTADAALETARAYRRTRIRP